MDPLAHSLDFANHHANSTPDDIKKLCDDVVKYGFHAAFVNPSYVTLAKEYLGTKAPVGTVVSFPLGQDTQALKMAIANNAVSQGVDELDVVPNIGTFLYGNEDGFLSELKHIIESAHMLSRPIIVKFILEPGYFDKLSDGKTRMARAAEMILASGADYVKIGSGMGPRNPTLEDLAIVKEAVGTRIKIKVAGGIETREQAEALLAAGAYHLGTSHAIDIVTNTTKRASSEKAQE
jgi:deoxyribose-phosphate aldolase